MSRDLSAQGGGESPKAPLMEDEDDALSRRQTASAVISLGVKTQRLPGRGARKLAMEFDIPEDAYGAAILALSKDLTDLVSEEAFSCLTLTRLTFPLVILAVNLTLQFLCLFFIDHHVVTPSVHSVQETYAKFHYEVFTANGTFLNEKWEDNYSSDEKGTLCQIAMTNQVFYYTILLLWSINAMHEIRTGQRLLRNILRVPSAENFGDQVVVDDIDDSKVYIRALKPLVRCLMIGVVVVPKIFISLALMQLGMRWLSATTSFEELVMNAVAMTFVTQIDELLYHFTLPAVYRTQVADINFQHEVSREEAESSMWKDYVTSAFYCALTFVIVWIYSEVQDVLPNGVYQLAGPCNAWQRENERLRCALSWVDVFRDLFTKGIRKALSTPESCYPFGSREGGEM